MASFRDTLPDLSLRQSCAQLCVKNGLRLPSKQGDWWVQIAGDLLPGWLSQRQWAGGPSLALEMPGCRVGRRVKARDRLLLHISPHPSCELSRAGTWGRDVPSFLCPGLCCAGQALLRKGLWT